MHELPKFPLLARIIGRVWLQVLILAILIAGSVLLEFVPETKGHPAYLKTISFVGIFIGGWIAIRILGVFREAPFVEAKLAPNLRPPVFMIFRIMIFSIVFLIALDSIGVSITPLIASLGVGSLAVGLALQDTLGNFFSGFYLYVDRPIAIGDWIRLESGVEGQVVSIGWRSTQLLMPQESMIVIPNSKLSSSALINFNLPTSETTLTISLGVAYNSKLDFVEDTLQEAVSRVASRMPSIILKDEPPLVRFTAFGESSIDLKLGVKVRSFPDQALVRHELVKEIKQCFELSKIEIPYPKRVIQQLPPL